MEEITKADYEALLAFRSAIRKFLRFSERNARAAGVTPQQHQTLLAIKGQAGKDWASVTEIASAMQVVHNAAVGLVDRCEALGLVYRTPAQEDRRFVQVRLTAKGDALLATLSKKNMEEIRQIRGGLDFSPKSRLGA